MMHAASFEASGVTLRTEVRGEMDCYCDLDRLRQVVINLLSNAIEALEPGGEVLITVEADADTTTISVTDTGHGMEPAAVYRIFDLFYTQKASGTGLGLPIVKNIVDAHGGTIDVRTRPKQGTTFTIRLPKPYRTGESP